jgi:hypothetical protein
MVLNTKQYDAAYFGDCVESGGIKTTYGYTCYMRQTGQRNRHVLGKEESPFNPRLKMLSSKMVGIDLANISVLDVGGAVGFYSEYGKELGISTWDVFDLNIGTWLERHKLDAVDKFITGDARTDLSKIKTNSYGMVFSSRFLDCIDDKDIPGIIKEMNRISGKIQVHIISETSNKFYNEHELSWWAKQGFNEGTRLISYHTQQVLVL